MSRWKNNVWFWGRGGYNPAMSRTYQAILRGDRVVQWRGDGPDAAEELEVQITVLSDPPPQERNGNARQQMMHALEQLAERGTLAGIDDPQRWQREQRIDRPLAGREQDRAESD